MRREHRGALLLVAAITAGMALPAGAERAGCTVLAPNPSGGGSCRYTANGPGVFTAHVPVGGWWIDASSDGGQTWRRLASGKPVIHDGTPGWPEAMPTVYPPASGALDTRAGDLVIATILLDHVCPHVASCVQVRVGTLEARDRT